MSVLLGVVTLNALPAVHEEFYPVLTLSWGFQSPDYKYTLFGANLAGRRSSILV